MAELRIGDMARLLGVTPKTVRHYHKLGLIGEPRRTEGGYRIYAPEDLLRLQRIKRLQALGLSLMQIQATLDAPDGDARLQSTLEALLADTTAQMAALRERQSQIERLLAEGVSLKRVQMPDAVSPTYEKIAAVAGDVELSPEMTTFDRELFAQIDSFQWSEGIRESLDRTAVHLMQTPETVDIMRAFAAQFTALTDAGHDDARITVWVEGWKASGVFETFAGIGAKTTRFSGVDEAVFEHIFRQHAEAHLSPAQREFLRRLMEF